MPFAKKSKSAVHVETKRMGDSCSTSCGMKGCHFILGLLLVANLVLTILLFCGYARTEAMKVGGSANYKLVKQIYKTQAFKDSQKQMIERALQEYNGGGAALPTQEAVPQVTPPTQ